MINRLHISYTDNGSFRTHAIDPYYMNSFVFHKTLWFATNCWERREGYEVTPAHNQPEAQCDARWECDYVSTNRMKGFNVAAC